MKTISYTDFKSSKDFLKLHKLWAKTWKGLVDNPFSKLIKDVDFDQEDLLSLIRHYCEHHYEDAFDRRDPGPEIKDIVNSYDLNDKTKKLLYYSFLNYVEYINDYLDSFNIVLVNTGRGEWNTIRFMNHFLGDINSNKVCLWHERYDTESGEFVVFDKALVEKCLNNNKFSELPNRVEPSQEYKDLAKIIEKENKISRDHQDKLEVDVVVKAKEILSLL